MAADLLSHYKEEDQERCDRQPSNLLSSELHKHCINQNGTYITFPSNIPSNIYVASCCLCEHFWEKERCMGQHAFGICDYLIIIIRISSHILQIVLSQNDLRFG